MEGFRKVKLISWKGLWLFLSLLLEQQITAQPRKDVQPSVKTGLDSMKKFCRLQLFFYLIRRLHFQYIRGSTGSAGRMSWQKLLKSEILCKHYSVKQAYKQSATAVISACLRPPTAGVQTKTFSLGQSKV